MIFSLLLAFLLPFLARHLVPKRQKDPEPKRMILLSFCVGFLSTILFSAPVADRTFSNLVALWKQFSAILMFPALFGTLISLLEEAVKAFAVLRLGSHLRIHFNQIVDGIIYSVSVALGFAFLPKILPILLRFSRIFDF